MSACEGTAGEDPQAPVLKEIRKKWDDAATAIAPRADGTYEVIPRFSVTAVLTAPLIPNWQVTLNGEPVQQAEHVAEEICKGWFNWKSVDTTNPPTHYLVLALPVHLRQLDSEKVWKAVREDQPPYQECLAPANSKVVTWEIRVSDQGKSSLPLEVRLSRRRLSGTASWYTTGYRFSPSGPSLCGYTESNAGEPLGWLPDAVAQITATKSYLNVRATHVDADGNSREENVSGGTDSAAFNGMRVAGTWQASGECSATTTPSLNLTFQWEER